MYSLYGKPSFIVCSNCLYMICVYWSFVETWRATLVNEHHAVASVSVLRLRPTPTLNVPELNFFTHEFASKAIITSNAGDRWNERTPHRCDVCVCVYVLLARYGQLFGQFNCLLYKMLLLFGCTIDVITEHVNIGGWQPGVKIECWLKNSSICF